MLYIYCRFGSVLCFLWRLFFCFSLSAPFYFVAAAFLVGVIWTNYVFSFVSFVSFVYSVYVVYNAYSGYSVVSVIFLCCAGRVAFPGVLPFLVSVPGVLPGVRSSCLCLVLCSWCASWCCSYCVRCLPGCLFLLRFRFSFLISLRLWGFINFYTLIIP